MRTRIKQLRQEKHYTQEYLASQIGTNQAALSKIECGISIPDAHLIITMSELFQVSSDYILYLSEHKASAEILLKTGLYNQKKYEEYFFIARQFSSSQRVYLRNFLKSVMS